MFFIIFFFLFVLNLIKLFWVKQFLGFWCLQIRFFFSLFSCAFIVDALVKWGKKKIKLKSLDEFQNILSNHPMRCKLIESKKKRKKETDTFFINIHLQSVHFCTIISNSKTTFYTFLFFFFLHPNEQKLKIIQKSPKSRRLMCLCNKMSRFICNAKWCYHNSFGVFIICKHGAATLVQSRCFFIIFFFIPSIISLLLLFSFFFFCVWICFPFRNRRFWIAKWSEMTA